MTFRFCALLCVIMKNFIIIVAFAVMTVNLSAQDFAIKSNVLSDVTGSANLGIEFGGGNPKWSYDITGYYSPWDRSNGVIRKHLYVQPEARWWFCDRFSGHFLAAHAHGGIYNIGNIDADFKFLGSDLSQLKDHRFQGWFVGAGVAYGYALILGRHWNLEFELGLGYAYTRGDKYQCEECGDTIYEDRPAHYVGPTKAAISLVYVF